MPSISGAVGITSPPTSTVKAWKASRFGSAPAYDTALPVGSPDAGPVTPGPAYGGAGEWTLTLPTVEDYYISAEYNGHIAWEVRGAPGLAPTSLGGPATTSAVGDAAVTGTAATASYTDHKHGREAFATPLGSAVGDVAAAGSAATLPRSDHVHGREAFATNTIALGTAAAAGAATTLIRSDATLLAFDVTVPVTQAFGDAAAVGAATVASRRDHKHGMPATPPGFANPMTTVGDIISGGTAGAAQRLGVGSAAQVLTVVSGAPAWATALASPTTTKGDLAGYSTVSARIPIGTDAQVLTADSTQALGLKWATSSSGFADPTTTKGDLIAHGATTTRIGVGADTQVLTADSTTALGVKWAAPGAASGKSYATRTYARTSFI